MITTDAGPQLAARLRGYDLRRVSPSLWRVVDARGVVAGHVAELADSRGVRYEARRYSASARAFVEIGGFWRMSDAVAAVHDSR
ncbi:hypothetical protein AB3M83_08365 [Microbacterium sp. 179-B 1A2 NHS]|uniref:hypothetical protein n=1 Tax=Microbacterium sp. 179-B 1A2 NHS TaxID=3142383 RepID=UPI0039A19C36